MAFGVLATSELETRGPRATLTSTLTLIPTPILPEFFTRFVSQDWLFSPVTGFCEPSITMSAPEAEDTQSTYGDGAGGPGAPTPLSALEVVVHLIFLQDLATDS